MRFDKSKPSLPFLIVLLTQASVIALSKVFTLNDPRVVQTMVKGDLIVPVSDRIMTRSKAKLSKPPLPSPSPSKLN